MSDLWNADRNFYEFLQREKVMAWIFVILVFISPVIGTLASSGLFIEYLGGRGWKWYFRIPVGILVGVIHFRIWIMIIQYGGH